MLHLRGRSSEMGSASAEMKTISQTYVQEIHVAAGFEREILNARINFIYYVTIQKPGTLENGWKRFENARALVPALQKLARNPQFPTLRQPSEQASRRP